MPKRGNALFKRQYILLELWLHKTFPAVIFLNCNMPEKSYKIFKKKDDIDQLPDDITDIFQRNMLDRYIDRLHKHFENSQYGQIDQLCFAEFLSLYCVLPKTTQISENDCQPVVLNDKLVKLNHGESRCPDKFELITHINAKLKC